MADIKTCIVLDALDVSVLGEVEALADFAVGATAHSIAIDEGVNWKRGIDAFVLEPHLPPLAGVPSAPTIEEIWHEEAICWTAEVRQLAERLRAVPETDRFCCAISNSALVTMLHYFQPLMLPAWSAIGEVVTARDPATTCLVVLGQPRSLDGVEGYGRANSGGRWFVEATDEGNIIRRCGIDRGRGIGYWGADLDPKTYNNIEVLLSRSAPASQEKANAPETQNVTPEAEVPGGTGTEASHRRRRTEPKV